MKSHGHIVLLPKSLYGLRQEPKLWWEHFAKMVDSIGFKRSTVTDCLFIYATSNPDYVIIYVDELFFIGYDTADTDLRNKLSTFFTVTDLGSCLHFLGLTIDSTEKGIILSQKGMPAQSSCALQLVIVSRLARLFYFLIFSMKTAFC